MTLESLATPSLLLNLALMGTDGSGLEELETPSPGGERRRSEHHSTPASPHYQAPQESLLQSLGAIARDGQAARSILVREIRHRYPRALHRQLDIDHLHPTEIEALQVLEKQFSPRDLENVFSKKTWRFLYQGVPLYRIFLTAAGLYEKDKGVKRAVDKIIESVLTESHFYIPGAVIGLHHAIRHKYADAPRSIIEYDAGSVEFYGYEENRRQKGTWRRADLSQRVMLDMFEPSYQPNVYERQQGAKPIYTETGYEAKVQMDRPKRRGVFSKKPINQILKYKEWLLEDSSRELVFDHIGHFNMLTVRAVGKILGEFGDRVRVRFFLPWADTPYQEVTAREIQGNDRFLKYENLDTFYNPIVALTDDLPADQTEAVEQSAKALLETLQGQEATPPIAAIQALLTGARNLIAQNPNYETALGIVPVFDDVLETLTLWPGDLVDALQTQRLTKTARYFGQAVLNWIGRSSRYDDLFELMTSIQRMDFIVHDTLSSTPYVEDEVESLQEDEDRAADKSVA